MYIYIYICIGTCNIYIYIYIYIHTYIYIYIYIYQRVKTVACLNALWRASRTSRCCCRPRPPVAWRRRADQASYGIIWLQLDCKGMVFSSMQGGILYYGRAAEHEIACCDTTLHRTARRSITRQSLSCMHRPCKSSYAVMHHGAGRTSHGVDAMHHPAAGDFRLSPATPPLFPSPLQHGTYSVVTFDLVVTWGVSREASMIVGHVLVQQQVKHNKILRLSDG